jgi:hypothetical protein
MSKEQGTAIAKKEASTALVLHEGAEARMQAVVSKITELGAGLFDLKKVKIPTGGATIWSVPTPYGDEGVKEIEAVILTMKFGQKVWYKSTFEDGDGNSPPDCQSHDGVNGWGINSLDEGAEPAAHVCATCPWNEFGSSRKGGSKGKDCRDTAAILLWFVDNEKFGNMPYLLIAPPTSLKSLRSFALNDLDGPYTQVVTGIGLEKVTASIAYSRLKPRIVRKVTDEEAEKLGHFAKALKDHFESRTAKPQ